MVENKIIYLMKIKKNTSRKFDINRIFCSKILTHKKKLEKIEYKHILIEEKDIKFLYSLLSKEN